MLGSVQEGQGQRMAHASISQEHKVTSYSFSSEFWAATPYLFDSPVATLLKNKLSKRITIMAAESPM